ncbi:basic amino acid/polyamine antiporter [Collinsella vaginalis]|uniref:basic amino acid/polyamine antiporter n=1 Tax=Collinsella vaginalis TaxID=1870987 RepID=UPI000A26F842|nr:basic amino acid/polyamine antiporter [Collinsella vaginalis]
MTSPSRGGHPAADSSSRPGIGLIALIALVISSSIGSGVFALSADISRAAAPGPALIAWLITGAGFMGLATTLGRLSVEKPGLNGIVAYAREGFGPFVGFICGWGYWLSTWIGVVAFSVMFISALGYFLPVFSGGLSPLSLALNSVITWSVIWLVNRGVERASAVNAIVMVCKLVPIFVFIATMVAVFRSETFTLDIWGANADTSSGEAALEGTGGQIIDCLMVMMWVFVGMEGATVLGHRARRKADVSRATVLGTTALVILYIAASILPYGFLPRAELMAVGTPSMAFIFQEAVGPWGGAFIVGGLIVSIFGAWLSYLMLASETLSEMARTGLMPRMFAGHNTWGAPTSCLIATGVVIQILSVVTLFSAEAYRFAYSLCTAAIVVSWSLAAAYQVKLAWPRRREGQLGPLVIAAFTCAFLVTSVLISGARLLMLCCIAYVPGFFFYLRARRERGAVAGIATWERALAAGVTAAAASAIVLLAIGGISL